MTEILLEVTTDEIREAAVEAIHHIKGKSNSRAYLISYCLFLLFCTRSIRVTLLLG